MNKLYKSFIAFLAALSFSGAHAQISQPVGPGGRPLSFTAHGVLLGQGTSNVTAITPGAPNLCLISQTSADPIWASCSTGAGTVTQFNFTNGSGFSGSVTNATTTPTLALTTSVSGMLKGSAGSLVAGTSGTDYSAGTSALSTGILKSTTGTGALSIAVAGDFPTLNQNTTGTASNVTGTVAVANGGTGLTATPSNGQIDIGNGSGFTRATITAGTGISVTNGSGSITIASTGSTNNLQYAWGDCSDGNATISSGTTTLTRDMFYNSLTLSGTGVLNTAGYRVYVCSTLDISAAQSGAIIRNGNNGSGLTAGAALTTNYLGGSGAGGAGGNGGVGSAGSAGGNGGGVTNVAGSSGDGNAGGAGASNAFSGVPYPTLPAGLSIANSGVINYPTGGAGGGGGGGATSGGAGAGGGGGGSGGGVMVIAANTIARGTNSNTSIIQVKGGNGAAGGGSAANGGGGGAGGGGGWFILTYQQLTGSTITNAIDLSGGTGGNGGAGTTAGGNGGAAGDSGKGFIYNFGAGTLTTLNTVAGPAGSAHSGTTPGNGATNTQRFNL